ncbi:MAG: OmpA family protein [Nitrospiraceae bacterium]
MKPSLPLLCLTLALSGVALTLSGCSKKSVQASSGGKSSEAAKRAAGLDSGSVADQTVGAGKTFEPEYSTNAPSLSLSDGDMNAGLGSGGGSSLPPSSEPSGSYGSNSLSGLDSVRPGAPPAEERLGGGTLMAKVQPNESAARQADELRAEQMAAAAVGMRDVFFGYDSWQINEEGRRSLVADAEWIRGNANALVKIEGHCDERGTGAYNLVLGEKRAKAVRNYLVELGVPASQLTVVSYGKERPFCMERAESCYQQNRRGHLVLRKK